MPARISRSTVPNAIPKNVRAKTKKRTLDVYAAASKDIKEKRVPQHRLGEDLEDDEPRSKRPRTEEDGEDENDADAEYARHKRRAARSIRNADNEVQYGSDSSGNEWTVGGLGEDDDDSELDSDEAFGDSDEERFEGFTFRGSTRNKSKSKKTKSPIRRKKGNDLDEGTEDEDDDGDSEDDIGAGLGEDAVDLAAMLDESDEEALDGNSRSHKASEEGNGTDTSEEESEFSDSEDTDDEEGEDDDDGSADEERIARMMDRLENLDAPRKSGPSTAAVQPSLDLTLEDLLSGIDPESRKRYEGESKTKKKSKNATTISAPLPKRQQDRLDREVATQRAKEQLDRWRDTVVHNRRAEFLSFPMVDPNEKSKYLGKEKLIPASQGAPQTELEASIQRIMEESGLSAQPRDTASQDLGGEEAALLKSEELATNKLPIEEVMRRRADLRKARELLFREEIKARRIAKIKSKSYRRVHRKEREKLAEQERQAMHGLGGDDAMDEDDVERFERRRAEARVATKHKDSKWAKALKATNRAVWDESARDSILDQAKRNEDLKKRIAGRDVSDDSSIVSHSESEDEGDAHEILQRIHDSKMNQQASDKGLSGLKFMRAAEERRRKANDEDVERLRKELAIEAGDEEEDDEDGPDNEGLGRTVFGPQSKQRDASPVPRGSKLEFEAPDISDNEDHDTSGGSEEKRDARPASTTEKSQPKGILKSVAKASGPLAKSLHAHSKKSHGDQDRSGVATSDWLSKPREKSNKKQTSADSSTAVVPQSKAKEQRAPSDSRDVNTDGWTTVTYRDEVTDGSDAETPSDPILSKEEQRKALQQRAFAGDDVQTAFDEEKEGVADSEDEKEISNHLPGWGSWTGDGLSRSIRKANQRSRHNPLFKSKVDGVRRADRKDAKLENVIISEKQDRKGKKYMAPILPHGFETKAQYERSKRLPMGPEWSTKEVHQRMTRPRVVVKPGVRLEALERPLV